MTLEQEFIGRNIEKLNEKIRIAASKSGRQPDDITVIGVSKTVGADRISKAIQAGLFDFGENKVQELVNKYETIGSACRWHMVGHLQTNKVKYIIDKIDLIHSVDSIRLAKEIDRQASKVGIKSNILVQVNIADEESKFGIGADETITFIKKIAEYDNIYIKGLMTIAPYSENPEDVRWVFKALKKLFIDISRENTDNISMDYLSMGMSNDFELAIEEGSNMVRIGTAIFGKRDYMV